MPVLEPTALDRRQKGLSWSTLLMAGFEEFFQTGVEVLSETSGEICLINSE